MKLLNIINNSIFIFTICRYFGYGLQAIRSILIAKILGPHFFGIWGFLMMVEKYLFMTSFGVPNALNLELSTNSSDNFSEKKKIVGSGLFIIIIVAVVLFVCGFGVKFLNIKTFEPYLLGKYINYLILLSILNHFKQILIIYRLQGKLNKNILSDLFLAISLLSIIYFFREESLIQALLLTNIVAIFISIIVFLIHIPIPLSIICDIELLKRILLIGIPLVVYNFSFYLISLSARTVISCYYLVEEMGYYSFATTLSNVSFLGINAIVWVLFPNILNKIKEGTVQKVTYQAVAKINTLYETSVFLIIYGMILISPVIFYFLPEYKQAESVLSILLLSQGFFSISFGYRSLALARRKQKIVAASAIMAFIIVVICSLFSSYYNLDYKWIAVSVLIGSFFYAIFQTIIGTKILQINGFSWIGYLPLGSIIAVFSALLLIVLDLTFCGGVLGLFIFIITNKNRLKSLWVFLYQKISGQSEFIIENLIK
ncbi:oligosaccharide flippase family protein [bacterium]|nr:oligosaccharide flippase family protein [bacterium]